MKHLYTLVGLLMAGLTASGYENCFVEGAAWETMFRGTQEPNAEWHTSTFTLADPGSVAGKDCLKLYETTDGDASTIKHVAWIASEGDKVYSLNDAASGVWRLIYDFGVAEGSECEIYDYRKIGYPTPDDPFTLKCVAVSEENGLTIRALEIYAGTSHSLGTEHWIDGIGDTHGITYNLYEAIDGIGSMLVKVTRDGRTVYENTAGITLTATSEIAVRPEGLDIIATGVPAGTAVILAAIDGKVLHSGTVDGGTLRIGTPAPGIYIVRIGDTVNKIATK